MDLARDAPMNLTKVFFSIPVFCSLVLLTMSKKAAAYPEFIKHGYSSCINCHSSVVGGDLLTMYGRVVKKEVLTSNYWTPEEQEQKELAIKTPEWLLAESNLRLLQYFNESSKKSRGRFMVMQLDVDAVAQFFEKWKVYFSVARYEPSDKESQWKDFIYTPRSWLHYEDDFLGQEKSLQIRAGKFFPSYGIYQVEHIYGVRRNLLLNPGQERLAAEVTFLTENNQWTLTKIFKRFNYSNSQTEEGEIFQYARNFSIPRQGDPVYWRLGLNFYRSTLNPDMDTKTQNKMDGIFASVGWNKQHSTLLQFDKIIGEQGREGRQFFLKHMYEYDKGWQLFAVLEYFNPWVERTDPHSESLGGGCHYFFLPNMDGQVFYKKEQNTADLNEFQDYLWFILHAKI